MSPFLPIDIIALIIDIVGESNDTDLLKELALVSHSFLHIRSIHLFATIDLHDIDMTYNIASSKRDSSSSSKAGHLLSTSFRQQRQSALTHPSKSPRNNSPSQQPHNRRLVLGLELSELFLTSALLHLMHPRAPTINHVDLSYIYNFPLSSIVPSVNLLRLNIHHLRISSDADQLKELTPLLTAKLLNAKLQDGRPAFNFIDLRRLSMSSIYQDEQNLRYLLQNAKSLEKFDLFIAHQNLVGPHHHGVLSLSARTLKVFDLSVSLSYSDHLALTWLGEELGAMVGRCMLEAFSFKVYVYGDVTEDLVGSILRQVEEVSVKPGWSASALRQVSFKVEVRVRPAEYNAKLSEALQSLPDKYLSHLPKHDSVAFNFSANVSSAYESE